MRPGQNKRMRGRNNRKGPNPLTRTYESNGPDVKIRGTAHHVAEKYLQLARDAHSSGDPVMAESYLQHAEHYFRLIAAAQLAQQQAQNGFMRAPDQAEQEEDMTRTISGLWTDSHPPRSVRSPSPSSTSHSLKRISQPLNSRMRSPIADHARKDNHSLTVADRIATVMVVTIGATRRSNLVSSSGRLRARPRPMDCLPSSLAAEPDSPP